MGVTQRLIATVVGVVLAFSGIGCVSTDATAPSGDARHVAKGCFNVRDVLSFEALHDKYVYVRCRRGKHYLLTM